MSQLLTANGFFGEVEKGERVREANVKAVTSVSNILKTSLGPNGLDKMLVDQVGDVTITNDGATILQLLEIKHSAAKVFVDLSQLQDQEIGDGTTSVVILAAELLKRGNQLVSKHGLHPTNVISGYRLASKEAVRFMSDRLAIPTSQLGRSAFVQAAKTTLSSKLIGVDSEFFSEMCVKALEGVAYTTAAGKSKYPVAAVNVLKNHGRSIMESQLVVGYALERMTRGSQQMPRTVKAAKIALISFSLRQHRMQMGVQVEISDPNELEKVRDAERDICRAKCQKIISSGANVVLSAEGIDDLAMKYFVEAGIFAVRRVPRNDLRRIAKATGGQIVVSMAQLDSNEENFDPTSLGHAGEVCEERVGDWDYVFVRNTKANRAASIILRGANDFLVDEIERSVHDALCSVSRAMESKQVIVGGGCIDVAVSSYLRDFAKTLGSREQLAIAEFAEAMLVIPKTLALNASLDATEITAQLRATHNQAQAAGKPCYAGLDLSNGTVIDNLKAGVLEPIQTKKKMIKFATEATVTILRIDDHITLAPEPEPQRQ
ncbi:MAG: hypothetical protein KVP17_002603 [Porospora cf. gigantea B]|uniref:uncharacterized protein n=1 Tax=Porospora cf. gigantea B TaxID=2853592 RepID=UPI0035717E20|nr:MAG: hypothetical protein KVP17_002603 [Porospora cf. gigantea B]